MKKQISALVAALAATTMMTSLANADVGTIAPGNTVRVISTASGVTPTAPTLGCEVLSSGVTIGTSSNVNAAFDCRRSTATTPAAIGVGSCHVAGLIKNKTYSCGTLTTNGCAGDGTGTYEAAGASFFSAVTTGGSVVSQPLGAACDASGIQSAVSTATTAGIALASQ